MPIQTSELPTISSTEKLSAPFVANPIVDHSKQFKLPFRLQDLPRMSELYVDEGVPLGTRSLTDRRAYSYPPVVFERIHPIIRHEVISQGLKYCDLQIKGGGATIPDNTLLYRKEKRSIFKAYDPAEALPKTTVIQDTIAPVRYTTYPVGSLSGELGFVYKNNELSDAAITEYLESNYGLRTRALVAMWEIPDKAEVVTPEGKMSISDVKNLLKFTPVMDAWAMRCKFRVLDPMRMIYELESGNPEPNTLGLKLQFAGSPREFIRKQKNDHELFLSHDPENNMLNANQKQFCEQQYIYLAKQIINRALEDEDSAFVQLGKRFQSIGAVNTMTSETKPNNIEQFYKEYLHIFSDILGKQFGIMEEANAISGMMNLQNITLLAELVDHDVTLIQGRTIRYDDHRNPIFVDPNPKDIQEYSFNKNDPTENYIYQLHIGWLAISTLIRDLSRTGILPVDQNVTDNRNLFLTSYLSYLRSHIPSEAFALKMTQMYRRSNMLIDSYGDNFYDSFYAKRIDPEDYLGEGEQYQYLLALRDLTKPT